MAIIEKWNYDVIKKINREEEIAPGRLNNKAKIKLNEVVDGFEKIYGDNFNLISSGVCTSEFEISGKQYDVPVKCYYDMKNMILGRNYDLMLSCTVDIDDLVDQMDIDAPEMDSFVVNSKFSGKLRAMDVKFGRNKGDDFALEFAEAISIPLITRTIKRLGLINVRVEYNQYSRQLTMTLHSMRGSSTWCLIPPIFQLIQLKEEDCIDIINLFQMLMHGICKTAKH